MVTPDEARERVDAVARRLDEVVARLDHDRDGLAIFAFTYRLMTRRIGDAVSAEDGGGMDPAWVARIVELFAGRFFAAEAAWQGGQPAPAGWAYILEQLATRRTSVLEEMVLGMAAHILYDLPLAVLDLEAEGMALESTLADYHRMNDVLADAIDEIQARVAERYQPKLRFLDRLVGNQDEILTSYGIRLSRGMAWYNAKRLLGSEARSEVEASIARAPEGLARLLFEPSFVGRVFRCLRWLSSFFRRWPSV